MNNLNYPPAFEAKVKTVTRTPQPDPEFVEELWTQIAAQPLKRPSIREQLGGLFRRPAWAASITIVLVVILLFIAVGPQRVLAAFRSLFGYFPGIGFVQNPEAVRRLEEPVQIEREGYVVTVEDLVASEQQTWIKVRVEGVDRVSDDIVTPLRGRDGEPSLLVDDGQRLSPVRSQSYGRSPMTAEYVFSPLPGEIQTVTLALPQLPRTPKGAAPENWQFTLHLRPVGPDEGLPATIEQDWQSPPSDGLTLILDTIAQGADQTVLSVRIEAENPRIRPAEDWTARLSLKDESGRIYPLTDENLLGNQDELAHALRTMAFEGGERLTLRLDQLLLAEALPPDSSAPDFRFDPGDRPQIGQTWQLDQSLSSERFTINIIGAELEQGPDGQVRLVFSVEGQPGLESVLFGCSAPICVGGEGGGLSGGPIEPAVLLKGLPTGPINIRLDTVYYRAAGPWEIHWQPPTLPEEISTQPTNTPAPTPTRVPSPTAASEDPILAEVMTLFDRGLSPFQTSSGWVHVVVENQTGGDLGQDSRGGSIPSHSIMENWYELDPGGFITRMITLMKTPDGQVVQQAVTVGRYSYNFTLDTFLEFDDKPRKINFANEAITFLQQMIANDLPLYRQETPCEGRACLLVTPFEPGVQPSRETYDRIYEAAGLPRQVWIDLETGWPILQERFQMDTGGVVQPWDSNRLLTLERASLPPLRLLHLFDQVAFPTSEPQSRPTPTATFQAPLAVEVQALLQKGFDAIYSQEGWVHVAWEDISPEDTEEYHSGKVGPAHSFGESWMYVEADGTISREVWLEKTVDGTVWRKIARAGKTQVDFFAGTAVEDEELLHKTQPDSLPLTIEAAERNDGQALREEVDLDGRPSWLIILAYTFDPAMEITPLPKPVIGAENRTWIDRESGQIFMFQQSWTFEDGSTMITRTLRYHTHERVDAPPQEVLELLEQVIP